MIMGFIPFSAFDFDAEKPDMRRGVIYPLLVISLGVMIVIIGLYALGDEACIRVTRAWLPAYRAYPGAQEISLEYDFVRAFGMGRTTLTLDLPDTFETVRRWYIDLQRARIREGAASRPLRMRFTLRPANDPQHTQAIFEYQCAVNMTF